MAADKLEAVRDALHADKGKPLIAVDPYGGGKELGALARLTLVADEVRRGRVA